MDKIKLLLSLLGLILIPIIANLIFLIVFLLFSLFAPFISAETFYEVVKIIKESLAKFE